MSSRWLRRGRRQGFRSDRGAQAVEFALVAPLLLTLVWGMVVFGFVLNTQVNVTTLARAGARAVAICGQPTGCDTAATTAVNGANPGYLSNVQVTNVQQCATPTGDASVTVTASSPISGALAFNLVGSVAGKATTPCGG